MTQVYENARRLLLAGALFLGSVSGAKKRELLHRGNSSAFHKVFCIIGVLLLYIESAHLRIASRVAELLLDAEKLIVFSNALRA